MSNVKKLMMTAAGGEALNVEDVFSTYLYEGNSSTQTITNGIDLSGEGGMVWQKSRTNAFSHRIHDTERGATKGISSENSLAEFTDANALTSFNSDGFSIGSANDVNYTGYDYVSWTFRKAPKFFDVVTYTGNGTAGRTVSHNLGSVPGCIIVKNLTDANTNWNVYHRGNTTAPETDVIFLDLTNATADTNTRWNDTAPTSTVFTLGQDSDVNGNGKSYVAYLFAHNDGDGDFGPTGDQDIIKCGSYTGNATGNGEQQFIDLGFEPQWLLIKRASTIGDWFLFDNMRGIADTTAGNAELYAHSSDAEIYNTRKVFLNPTGFTVEQAQVNDGDYIYIAIRRGPMAVPESATDVFAIDWAGNSSSTDPWFTSDFPVDLGIHHFMSSGNNHILTSRLFQGKYLKTNNTDAETSISGAQFDYMDGYYNLSSSQNTGIIAHMWKRAPNFFDVVAYTGNGTAGRDIPHNLGVTPEMIWVKKRSSATDSDWAVYHTGLDQPYHYIRLNLSNAYLSDPQAFDSGNHTATTFSVGLNARTNGSSGQTYIAYLFASLDGISKVGSFSPPSSGDLTIDCGFTSGARFVLIKGINDPTNWLVWDTERGIISGNDPFLSLNNTNAQSSSFDAIDPHSSGFTIPSSAFGSLFSSSTSIDYLFYAIA